MGHVSPITGTQGHGFVTDGVTFTPIEVPGATYTIARDINNRGQIVGYFHGSPGTRHGFVTDGVTFTRIDVPGATYTTALGINDDGQIVGFFEDVMGTRHGFVTDGVTFTTIEVPGARYTMAFGINAAGQIVGEFQDATETNRGFVTDGATFTTLDPPGAEIAGAQGINNRGQIVGYFYDATGGHGFLASPDGVDETPPVITVLASPATLWPPNGQLVTITVSGTITDESGGSGVSGTTYQVLDEYGQIQPSGSVTLMGGKYAFTVALQASRRGNDSDGRHYTITVSATDMAGNRGDASATVTVPRN